VLQMFRGLSVCLSDTFVSPAKTDEPIKMPFGLIRYDTRCYFNVRSKADISQLNLVWVQGTTC